MNSHSKRGRKPSQYKQVFWETLPKSTNRPIGEILESIDSLTKEAFSSVDRPHELQTLSEAVAKMPAYMKGLGYYLADAEQEVSLSKDDYEFQKAQVEKKIIQTPISVSEMPAKFKSVAEAERESATNDELVLLKDKLRKAQHNFRVLKLQYDASNRQFEGWRSRLAVIKNDIAREV